MLAADLALGGGSKRPISCRGETLSAEHYWSAVVVTLLAAPALCCEPSSIRSRTCCESCGSSPDSRLGTRRCRAPLPGHPPRGVRALCCEPTAIRSRTCFESCRSSSDSRRGTRRCRPLPQDHPP